MNDNTELWRAQIESTIKAALAAPGADAPVPFTAGLLAALLGMNAKAANLGVEFAQEVLLKHLASAPAATPDLSALVEPIAQAIEKAVSVRVAAEVEKVRAELQR